MLVNHLKNKDSQNQSIAWASGLHVVEGNPLWSETNGTTPNRQATVRQILGRGEWNKLLGVWFDGVNVPTAHYRFLTGSKPTQTGDASWFPTDTSHAGYAILDYKTPTGLDFDSTENPPTGLKIIAETGKFRNWNSSGTEISADYGYTTNGARIFVDWYLQCGGSPGRINWANWAAWRDYIGANETQDYTTIQKFVGFGITAKFYNGTNFQTFVSQRVEPFFDFNLGNGSPAIGVEIDNFSIRCEGKLKPNYTETYTFTVVHDNGVRFWLNGNLLIDQWQDDGQHPAGTHTCTFAATANQFVDLKIEYNEGGGPGYLKLQWQSTSQAIEVIPPEVMYPKAESKPRYETHVAFASATDLDAVMKAILLVNNSVMQDFDGKMNFYCYEQLSSSFHISEDKVLDGTLKLVNRSFKKTDIKTRWEAIFRDIDSLHLEAADAINPCFIDLSRQIDDPNPKPLTEAISLPNMSRWQATKLLKAISERKLLRRNFYELECDARTFQVVAGDVITLSHQQFNFTNKPFLVVESRDKSPESSADDRSLILQEWS
jgi:PA14 domain